MRKRKRTPQDILKATRNLCPSGRSGITEVTLSSGGRSVTLTSATRHKCNALLKAGFTDEAFWPASKQK